MYLRFVLPGRDPDSGVEAGVFRAAYDLLEMGEISAGERQELAELIAWFKAELATPTRFNRTKSKGADRRAAKDISWIKDTALEHVKRLQRLAQVLRDNGHHVAMIRSANPGYIVYEDDHQIVTQYAPGPFKDMLQRV